MIVNTERMIPVTRLQKELMKRLKEVSETGEPLYILRSNEMAAVIVPVKEYELLKQAEEALEHLEIAQSLKSRLKGHDRKRNIPWDKIKKKHGL